MCPRSGKAECTEAKFVAAAMKIQKSIRGFLVKKNVRTVRKAAVDAERIALLVTRKADSIRVGEMLMALLLRLDSARGVREYRKKVVRRVLLIQEAVDSNIAASAPTMSPESPIPEEESKEMIGIEWIPKSATAESLDQVEEIEEIKEVMEKGRIVESSSATIQVQEMMHRMEGLMNKLCEQSAQQCGLMGELVQRVEQLEKKFQRMDKRKQLVQRIEQLEQKVQRLRKRKAGDALAC